MSSEIKVSKAVQEARKAVFAGGLSQYRTPYSRELEGKSFDLVFDDGKEMTISFPSRNRISFQLKGEALHNETAYCMKADDGAYFIMTEIAGSKPRQGMMILLDTSESLVTVDFVTMGAVKERPNLVTRTVSFGAIRYGDEPLPEKRHHYTHDLEGKKIDWTYNPNFTIMHVYLKNNCYTVALNDEMKARMEKARRDNPPPEDAPPRMNPYYEEDCLYIKLRENLYMFSFIEKNGGGTQGMMIINTDRVHDVGSFWGPSPDGSNEAYMFSAYGRWVREHIPEDDTLDKIQKK